jgi:hypothetical protein
MSDTSIQIHTYQAELQGVTPYQQGRYYMLDPDGTKRPKETNPDYEERTWRMRLHVGPHGTIVIPSGAFKLALENAAKFRAEKIPGEGKKTYTQRFKSGVAILDDMDLGIASDSNEVVKKGVFGSSTGKSGSGSRVLKYFPTIMEWAGTLEVVVYDPLVTDDVLKTHLIEAGQFIGVGVWRPINGGQHGRFRVVSFKEV